MKKPKREDIVTEIKCPACEGTGLAKATQPVQPGRKIYPPRCKACSGKGRIEVPRS
jgi:DnaJ-class molecular chaperone